LQLPAGLYLAGPDVYYSDKPLVVAGPEEVAFLVERARESPRLRSRLCTHPSVDDGVHEMLIVHHRTTYVRPHRHKARSESLTVIDGEGLIVFFDDAGEIVECVELGAAGSGRSFYYRSPPGRWHTLIIRSDWLVYHEVIPGPFQRSDTEYPSWAPDGENAAEAQLYRNAVVGRARKR
jgi:cupin fold WbuC family metalloprotein